MAKQGMKRFYPKHKKNDTTPVPEISGKAKSGKTKAPPIIAGTAAQTFKVYHARPHGTEIPAAFRGIDNDLAAENMLNDFDMTAADLQDLKGQRDR